MFRRLPYLSAFCLLAVVMLQGCPPQESPQLSLSATALNYATGESQKSFEISNSGTGTLAFNLATEQDWVSLSPSTGSLGAGQSTTINVDVSPGENKQSYTGNIAVSSNGGSGNVAISVNRGTGDPVIAVTAGSLDFAEGQTSKTFEVYNNGGGTLNFNLSASQGFITVSPTSGSSNGAADRKTITVTVPQDIKATFSGTITVTSNGGNRNIGVSINRPGTATGEQVGAIHAGPELFVTGPDSMIALAIFGEGQAEAYGALSAIGYLGTATLPPAPSSRVYTSFGEYVEDSGLCYFFGEDFEGELEGEGFLEGEGAGEGGIDFECEFDPFISLDPGEPGQLTVGDLQFDMRRGPLDELDDFPASVRDWYASLFVMTEVGGEGESVPAPLPDDVDFAEFSWPGGDDVNAFQASVRVDTGDLVFTSPAMSTATAGNFDPIDLNDAFTFQWTPSGISGAEVHIGLYVGGAFTVTNRILMLRLPDTGSYTVPASVMQQLQPAKGAIGGQMIIAQRRAYGFKSVPLSAGGTGKVELVGKLSPYLFRMGNTEIKAENFPRLHKAGAFSSAP